jgi:hypothetical protein
VAVARLWLRSRPERRTTARRTPPLCCLRYNYHRRCPVAANRVDGVDGIDFSAFTAAGKLGAGETQADADSRFETRVKDTVEKIKKALWRRATSFGPDSAQALEAYFWFSEAWAKYSARIKFVEIVDGRGSHAGGGTNRRRTRGELHWDPNKTVVSSGTLGTVSSAPEIVFAHELFHVLKSFETTPDMQDRYKDPDGSRYSNLWEFIAIEFENLARAEEDPPRTFHNPDAPP